MSIIEAAFIIVFFPCFTFFCYAVLTHDKSR